MAMRAGAPLIPVAVWGCQRIMTKSVKKNMERGLHIVIRYGEPIAYEPDEDPRDVTKRMMAAITDMVVDLQDRYPQSPADDSDRWWLPARLGGTAPTPEEAERMAREERIARRAKRRAAREGAVDGADPVTTEPSAEPPVDPPEDAPGSAG